MAAREVMERENVLDLESAKGLLNPVLPKGERLWPDIMEPLIRLDWKRLTGTRWVDYSKLQSDKDRAGARATAAGVMKKRLASTIQYRHEWIHNCGRPKEALMKLSNGQAHERVRDIREVIRVVDDHLMEHRQI